MHLLRAARRIFGAACLFALAMPSPAVSQARSDQQLFLDAIYQSRNGRHDDARRELEEYKERHPEDLLVPIRLGLDTLFDVRTEKRGKDAYAPLVALMNDAIARYENPKIECSQTNLQEIGGGQLDCSYVGAALYSCRAVFRMKAGANPTDKAVRDDDARFVELAGKSSSKQALFLLGVQEYKLSEYAMAFKLLNGIAFITHFEIKMPHDRDHALRSIALSLADRSPFRDDILLFILWMRKDHKPCGDEFARRHLSEDDEKQLRVRYPNNRIFQEGDLNLSDSY